MQVQLNKSSKETVSVKQLLIDEIYAPQTSKTSAKVLVMNTNQLSKFSVEANNKMDFDVKSQKSEFQRFLEAFGDCV